MATATAGLARTPRVPRWVMLCAYLAVLIAAEAFIAIGNQVEETAYEEMGLAVHILLLFALIVHGTVVWERSPVFGALLLAMSLASLIRVFSLAIPLYTFTIVQRLALVSAPFLASIAAVAYVQRLRARDLGLVPRSWRDLPVQSAIGLTGIPLGLLEFAILNPEPWIDAITASGIVVGTLAIFLATGISEEVVFRGIMLRRAIEGLGEMRGLLFVSVTFTALHIFFWSVTDLVFVFGVALFYGVAVIRTKSLWGVIVSHTLGNVMLYLIAPFTL